MASASSPTERLGGVALLGFVMGGLVAAASGYGLLGDLVTGVLTAITVGLAMIVRLAMEARDRRALRPVVRRPMSHVNQIHREMSA